MAWIRTIDEENAEGKLREHYERLPGDGALVEALTGWESSSRVISVNRRN